MRLVTLFSLCFILVVSTVKAALPDSVDGQPLPSLAGMVKQTAPAVVNISTRSHARIQQNPLLNDPFFRHFFRQKPQQRSRPQSLGSGVVIDAAKGLVISNHHVVHRADEITVTLRDGRELKAEILGSDPEADVALLKVPAVALTEIKIADSEKLEVGDFVVAIGNPFGLGQTVTSGIVSAKGRSGLGIEGYEDFIQTDASINPGNSGGALVNLRGELVGMNTAILAPGGNGGNIGIGFAIPSSMVMQIVGHLEQHGEVKRGVLGVVTQDLTPDLAQAFSIDASKGAVIARVFADSAASSAGIEAGDVVIEMNGRVIKSSADMRNQVGLLRIGDVIKMKVMRDGELKNISAKIGAPELTSISGDKLHHKLAGAELAQVQNPDNPSQMLVVINDVKQGSPAWYARLQKGDVLLSVNRRSVESLQQLQKLTNNQRQLLLSVQRGSRAMFVLLK